MELVEPRVPYGTVFGAMPPFIAFQGRRDVVHQPPSKAAGILRRRRAGEAPRVVLREVVLLVHWTEPHGAVLLLLEGDRGLGAFAAQWLIHPNDAGACAIRAPDGAALVDPEARARRASGADLGVVGRRAPADADGRSYITP